MCNLTLVRPPEGGEISERDSAIIKWLMAANSITNPDGVGLFDGQHIYRNEESGNDFFLGEGKEINLEGAPFVMGHVRKVSRGAKSLAFTHPFYVAPFVLAHNGTMNLKGGKAGEYCDSAEFTKFLAEKEGEDIVPALEYAFSKFESGTYAMLIYKRGKMYALIGKNTVSFFVGDGTLWMNTDKGRLESIKYLLRMYGIDCGTSITLSPGLYEIPPTGIPTIVEGTKDRIFLAEPTYTTVWTPKESSYSGRTYVPSNTVPKGTIPHVSGEEGLVEFVESLTVTDLSLIVKRLGQKYSEDALYQMLSMNPKQFLNLIKELLQEK